MVQRGRGWVPQDSGVAVKVQHAAVEHPARFRQLVLLRQTRHQPGKGKGKGEG